MLVVAEGKWDDGSFAPATFCIIAIGRAHRKARKEKCKEMRNKFRVGRICPGRTVERYTTPAQTYPEELFVTPPCVSSHSEQHVRVTQRKKIKYLMSSPDSQGEIETQIVPDISEWIPKQTVSEE